MLLHVDTFYHQLMELYSYCGVTMVDLLEEEIMYVWTPMQQETFDTSKQVVLVTLILMIVAPKKPFELEIEKSGVAIVAILNEDGKSVAFDSQIFSFLQQKWQVYEQKVYAIIHALKTLWHYLYGVEFKVRIDHCTLNYFWSPPNLQGRQGR